MHVVLGIDDNPIYQFYLPMTVKIWQAFNVEPLVFHVSDTPVELECEVVSVKPNPRWPTAWQAKASRLCVGSELERERDFYLLSDVDLWPLRRDWLDCVGPRWWELGLIRWGSNLHEWKAVICYTGACISTWEDFLPSPSQSVERALEWLIPLQRGINENADGVFSDETLLTYFLNHPYSGLGPKQTDISRGGRHGLDLEGIAVGPPADRIDRSDWDYEPHNPWDAHLPHDGWNHIPRLLDLFGRVCPNDVEWAKDWMEHFPHA